MTRTRTITVIGVAVLLGAPFAVPIFSPWSGINCRQYEIDIVSGQRRVSHFIYWIPIHRSISDTVVSTTLGEPPVRIDPQWRRTSTFGPFVNNSPHYVFHSAYHQTKMLELIWDEFVFDHSARRESAQELLSRWSSSNSDSSGDDYLSELTIIGEQGVPLNR